MTHGFGLTKDSPEVTNYADFFARHGYVVVDVHLQRLRGLRRLHQRSTARTGTPRTPSGLITALLDATRRSLARRDRAGRRDGRRLLRRRRSRSTSPRRRPGPRDRPGPHLELPGVRARPEQLRPPRRGPVRPPGRPRRACSRPAGPALFFALGNAQPVQGNGGCPQDKLGSGDPATVGGLPCTGYYLRGLRGERAPGRHRGRRRRRQGADRAGRRWARTRGRCGCPRCSCRARATRCSTSTTPTPPTGRCERQGTPVQMIWNSGGHGGYVSAARRGRDLRRRRPHPGRGVPPAADAGVLRPLPARRRHRAARPSPTTPTG